MDSLHLAPTASPSKWYSTCRNAQEEYLNVGILEAQLCEKKKYWQQGMPHSTNMDNITDTTMEDYSRMNFTMQHDIATGPDIISATPEQRIVLNENNETDDLSQLDALYLSDTQRLLYSTPTLDQRSDPSTYTSPSLIRRRDRS